MHRSPFAGPRIVSEQARHEIEIAARRARDLLHRHAGEANDTAGRGVSPSGAAEVSRSPRTRSSSAAIRASAAAAARSTSGPTSTIEQRHSNRVMRSGSGPSRAIELDRVGEQQRRRPRRTVTRLTYRSKAQRSPAARRPAVTQSITTSVPSSCHVERLRLLERRAREADRRVGQHQQSCPAARARRGASSRAPLRRAIDLGRGLRLNQRRRARRRPAHRRPRRRRRRSRRRRCSGKSRPRRHDCAGVSNRSGLCASARVTTLRPPRRTTCRDAPEVAAVVAREVGSARAAPLTGDDPIPAGANHPAAIHARTGLSGASPCAPVILP